MARIEIKLNYAGVGALLRGPEMAELMQQQGEEIRARAGNDYAVSVHDSGQRQIAAVYPATHEAWQDNLENNTLLRSLG